MVNYKFKFLAPLENFDSESPKIELGDDVYIRRTSENEKGKILGLIKYWPSIKYEDFLLECTIHKKIPEPEPNRYIQDGRTQIERVLTILRLYKGESIGYNLIIQPLADGENYGVTVLTMRHYQLWVKLGKFKILSNETENLKIFFGEYNVKALDDFKLAMHYFNKSYIEPFTPQDSFLDLLFSLENLYLAGENLELGYKLRMRMSHVLAKEFAKKKEIFEDIKKAYDFRGKIVHGGTPPKTDYNFLLKIREYTRESLKTFLKTPDLRENLDELIMKGSSVLKDS